ncbi:MAG TPA: hypothetical protein DCG85_07890 [Lachnospiraceae bacterium]|nr:hypothetical protein [Lachnospiraceae bacterium]
MIIRIVGSKMLTKDHKKDHTNIRTRTSRVKTEEEMKKRLGKRIINAVLTAALVITMMPATVFASGVSENDAEAVEKNAEAIEAETENDTGTDSEEREATPEEAEELFRNLNEALAAREGLRAYNEAAGNEDDALTEEMDYTRYIFFGDSTVVGNETANFPGVFAKRRGCRITNVAVGGATYSTANVDNNLLAQMGNVTLGSYDVAFILFGVNDFSQSRALGRTNSTDTSTVCGAMNEGIKRLKAANVNVYIILPFYYKGQFIRAANTQNLYFSDYITAIKNVAKAKNVSVIDFNTKLGINAKNYKDYYSDDVHPTDVLYTKAGEYLDSVMGSRTDPAEGNSIVDFVKRLYDKCLGRTPDTNGLSYWVDELVSGRMTGADVAKGVFFSDEFQSKNVSNEQYVALLYEVLMNRPGSSEEIAYWKQALDAGMTRLGVFKGFAESQEFTTLCGFYNILRGNVEITEARDKNVGLTEFVSRLYTVGLGRTYDAAGLNDWCNRILTKEWSVKDVSTTGFFTSPEYLNKNTDNATYVTTLYHTFFNREPDQAGYDYWLNKLNAGESRSSIIAGFADSVEFANLMRSYGL